MTKKILLTAHVAIIAILFTALPSNATVWRVNNNPSYIQGCNHCFSSLQVANDTSIVMAGDTIHLEASPVTYLGSGTSQATTLSKRLVILGPGYFLNQNIGLQKNAVSATIRKLEFLPGSDYSVIKGVSFFMSGNIYGVEILNASNLLIESCYLQTGLHFVNTNPISDITIKKCYITKTINSANSSNISNLLITNCFIGDNVNLYQGSTIYSGEIIHCVIGTNTYIDIGFGINFYNNIVTTGTFNQNTNGTTNVHDNIFIPSPTPWLIGGNNYSETALTVFPTTGSPDSILNVNPIGICPQCYTAYPGTEIFGIFGGADPYQLSGLPNIPSIYELQSPLNVIQGTPVNVNISTRSND